jgi:hypothetical protein
MAEEKPGLHIDDDWKRQAQEEKRRLAEQEAKNKPAPGPAGVVAGASPQPSTHSEQRPTASARREQQQLPAASFEGLVQSMVTQVLFYLGDLATRGGESGVNLDMAKHQIDTLTVLEEKTRGNLSDDEKHMLDAALYEVRMRYISVASQFAQLP